MGFESYLLRMNGRQAAKPVSLYLTTELGLKPDYNQYKMSENYSYFVLHDERHTIECELADRPPECDISLRFARCNPPSIDEVFTRLVSDLLNQFELTAVICEELPLDAPSRYTSSTTKEFVVSCKWSIAHTRQEWQREFGTEEAGLSTSEALRKFFLPDTQAPASTPTNMPLDSMSELL